MSEMEICYGSFRESLLTVIPEDTDDFYDLEEELGCYFVRVKGQLYSFETIENLEAYGFSVILDPPAEGSTPFMCMWYNGGAGIHEVVSDLIESSIK